MPNEFARHLRRNMTDAEQFVWKRLRGRQAGGFRFRRQAPVGRYVADFVCFEAKLIVELDGGQHAERAEQDAERTRWFESQGFRVVRFWNHEVFRDWDAIEEELWRLLSERGPLPQGGRADSTSPLPPSPLVGEGRGGGESSPPRSGIAPAPVPSPPP